ncbi:MAG: hypothetical protein JKY40_10590 [Gammaproteobacteria bacterium]|nr:hypothetical protein [Gammaproteobacteria bacterium]MBL4729733.1 hypothetical protein [Gammaproteobacteria bacterium]
MKALNKKLYSTQKGIGLVQVALALSVVAIVTLFAFQRFGEVSDDARNTAAFEEVTRWLGEMVGMGAVNAHVYTGLTQADVLLETSIDDATNVYGLAITAAVAAGNWALSYPFPAADACEYVESRIANHPGLIGTAPACSGANVLVATVE